MKWHTHIHTNHKKIPPKTWHQFGFHIGRLANEQFPASLNRVSCIFLLNEENHKTRDFSLKHFVQVIFTFGTRSILIDLKANFVQIKSFDRWTLFGMLVTYFRKYIDNMWPTCMFMCMLCILRMEVVNLSISYRLLWWFVDKWEMLCVRLLYHTNSGNSW